MITDYQLIESAEGDEVAEAVLNAIQDGWQPFGSISITVWTHPDCDDPGYWYCQPMVKYAEG